MHRGIVMAAGGLTYITNAFISVKLLRLHQCRLPIEIWFLGNCEVDRRVEKLFEGLGVTFIDAHKFKGGKKLHGWALKPFALLNSRYREVLFVDADNFAVRDPEYLFEATDYKEHGAVFWPDYWRADERALIWQAMNLPPKSEWEFESGQMLIDIRRSKDPLEFALAMNLDSVKWYKYLWGDKDTYRFAWHKFGRSYGMPSTPVQILSRPSSGGCNLGGVLCQHDFEGRRIFQHRPLYKWQLYGENAKIAGFIFEGECREFLEELRAKWDGRIGAENTIWRSLPTSALKEICDEKWIVSGLGKTGGVFQTLTAPKEVGGYDPNGQRENSRFAKKQHTNSAASAHREYPTGNLMDDLPWPTADPLELVEWSFEKNGTVKGAEARKLLFWHGDVTGQLATVFLTGPGAETLVLKQIQTSQGPEWIGKLRSQKTQLTVRLQAVHSVYPASRPRIDTESPPQSVEETQILRFFNSSLSFGEHICGVYAAAGIARSGQQVIYHTPYADWLTRVNEPGLTITREGLPGWGHPTPLGVPAAKIPYKRRKLPENCFDFNYHEHAQRSYAISRVSWFAGALRSQIFSPCRPITEIRRNYLASFDFDRYVVFAPLSDSQDLDWPAHHWNRLAHLFDEAGYHVVVLANGPTDTRLAEIFGTTRAMWIANQPAEWTEDALLGSTAVVAPEGNLIQLAGLLGIPGICVHSQFSGEFCFDMAPSIISAMPKTACTGCRLRSDRGYTSACDTACSALGTLGPEVVISIFHSQEMLERRNHHRLSLENAVPRSATTSSVIAAQPSSNPRSDVIAYTYAADCGLGQAAAMNIAAMRAIGLSVEQRIWKGQLAEEDALDNPRQIYYHHWHPQPGEANRVWRKEEFGTAQHIAYWAFEASGELPPEFIRAANLFNEIWVPSEFCREIFRVCGPPIHVLPHAIDIPKVPIGLLPSQSGCRPLTILFLFDAWSRLARKNPEGVIRVFQRAFKGRQDVRLAIKAHHLSPNDENLLRKLFGFDSRIDLYNRFMSEHELQELFQHSDILLSLQRGEGFGLNLAKGLAYGLPVVTTGFGGHLDFCSPENSFLVDWKLTEVRQSNDSFYGHGRWADPNEADAVAKLRYLATLIQTNDPVLNERRINGQKIISTRFSSENLNSRIDRLLRKFMRKPTVRLRKTCLAS